MYEAAISRWVVAFGEFSRFITAGSIGAKLFPIHHIANA
jgi:hypothetical protein